MNHAIAGLGIALAAYGVVALAFAASDARMVEQARPHPVLRRRGGVMALLLAAWQLGYALAVTDWASGIALVLSSLMVAGMLFIPAVNAAPKSILRAGLLAASAAPFIALLSL